MSDKIENHAKQRFMSAIIVTLVMVIIAFATALRKSVLETETLKQNQKPATDLYNENNKPCAGC